jgi:hypothetical protein
MRLIETWHACGHVAYLASRRRQKRALVAQCGSPERPLCRGLEQVAAMSERGIALCFFGAFYAPARTLFDAGQLRNWPLCNKPAWNLWQHHDPAHPRHSEMAQNTGCLTRGPPLSCAGKFITRSAYATLYISPLSGASDTDAHIRTDLTPKIYGELQGECTKCNSHLTPRSVIFRDASL